MPKATTMLMWRHSQEFRGRSCPKHEIHTNSATSDLSDPVAFRTTGAALEETTRRFNEIDQRENSTVTFLILPRSCLALSRTTKFRFPDGERLCGAARSVGFRASWPAWKDSRHCPASRWWNCGSSSPEAVVRSGIRKEIRSCGDRNREDIRSSVRLRWASEAPHERKTTRRNQALARRVLRIDSRRVRKSLLRCLRSIRLPSARR